MEQQLKAARDTVQKNKFNHGAWTEILRLSVVRLRCCVVRCGLVWFGVVWCGLVWFGVVWCGAAFSLSLFRDALLLCTYLFQRESAERRREIFEEYLQVFPTSASVWKQYIEFELANKSVQQHTHKTPCVRENSHVMCRAFLGRRF